MHLQMITPILVADTLFAVRQKKKDEHGFQSVDLVGLTSSRLREIEGQLMAHCREKIDPPVTPVVREERIDGAEDRRVLIFVIPSTGHAHSYRSDGKDSSRYWVRIGRETREARDALLRELLVSKGQLPPWDRRAARDADKEEIDLVALRDTFQRMGLWDPQRSIEDFLSSKEAVSPFVPPLLTPDEGRGERPRNFSLLLFGRNILKYIPGAHIVFSVYRGKDRSEPTAERYEMIGNVVDQTRKVIEQLNAEAYVAYDKESAVPNQSKYPIRALQEAVVNAIVHRDYEVDQPVRVTVFSDRVEIASPGALPRAIDEERFRSGRAAPFWQNQALAYFFSKLQFAQAEGQGIPTIIRTMHEEGCPPPSFVIEPGRVTCVLPAHPRHAILRELKAIENKIIIGRNDEAMNQLEALLDADPSNFRALELFSQASIAEGSSRRFLVFIKKHLETIKNTSNASTLLTISEALIALDGDSDAHKVAELLNSIAGSRSLEANEVRRAAINLRKLKDDDKAIDLIERMFQKEPSLRRDAMLLQLCGKAKIDLAKKCIEKARDRDAPKNLKSRAWDLCRDYLSQAERDFHAAMEFASGTEREYLERDLEFLNYMQQVSKKPVQPASNRPDGRSVEQRLASRFKVKNAGRNK